MNLGITIATVFFQEWEVKKSYLVGELYPHIPPTRNSLSNWSSSDFLGRFHISVMGCIPDVFNRHGCEVRVIFSATEKLHPTCHVLILDWGYLIGMKITMHTHSHSHTSTYIYNYIHISVCLFVSGVFDVNLGFIFKGNRLGNV